MRCAFRVSLAAVLVVTTALAVSSRSRATCSGETICCPNVGWSLEDSITACPAGDSVIFSHSPLHPHPSKLRITVTYTDNDCNPKPDIPAIRYG